MSLQQYCNDATHAFLQKNYLTSLQGVQKGITQALHNARNYTPQGVQLLERFLLLRYTVVITVYTNETVHGRVTNALKGTSNDVDKALNDMLWLPARALFIQLWYESLDALFGSPESPYPDSLEPSDSILGLILQIPGALLASAILGALRLDQYADRGPEFARKETLQGSACARQICEWYFAALLRAENKAHGKSNTYERIVRLYTLQILGLHLQEWDFAKDFVGYSDLPENQKESLFIELKETQQRTQLQSQREQQALQQARQQYEQEKHRRRTDLETTDLSNASAEIKEKRAAQPAFQPQVKSDAKQQQEQKDAATRSEHNFYGASLQRSASIRRRESRHQSQAAKSSTEQNTEIVSDGTAANSVSSALSNDEGSLASAGHQKPDRTDQEQEKKLDASTLPDTHATKRQRLRSFLAQRPMEVPSLPSESLTRHVGHLLFAQWRTRYWAGIAILLSFALMQSKPRVTQPMSRWVRLALLRVWETLRM
ncbi:hypothetical protein MPSI1_003357 [Malassezia psittaci]|uniref:Uncharacterized protein n=1 Tax=Malassezia psittaci TaxID=1821823 RepID=A0AAF0FC95_9BASI|nr:hypothetical protein MPSI1_003357 [Malassezia psittaci]